MTRDEERRESRESLLAKLRRRQASNEDQATDLDVPHTSAVVSGPKASDLPESSVLRELPEPPESLEPPEGASAQHAIDGVLPPLPHRLADHAARLRRPVPRTQRPDDQVLARVAKALRRL